MIGVKGVIESIVASIIWAVAAWAFTSVLGLGAVQIPATILIAALTVMFVVVLYIWLGIRHSPRLLMIQWAYAGTAIVVDSDNRFLLIEHPFQKSRSAPFHKIWLPPGGRLKRQQQPHEAAAYRVLRETGYTVKLHTEFHPARDVCVDRAVDYLPTPYAVHYERITRGFIAHYDLFYVFQMENGVTRRNSELTADWYKIEAIRDMARDGRVYSPTLSLFEEINMKITVKKPQA